MTVQLTYSVPEIHCDACCTAIETQVGRVSGVDAVDVDLDTKRVLVSGDQLDDTAIRDAIDAAGFELT
ncbi:MAG TPA: heavy-metal-associated domain-containing protein [Solirubrobacteraceae bacterium]|nr:heavy-metal-associated domain-containing protein [Solirubrobacteraceae bacterium]